jgi:hypothetical protein
MPIQGLDDGLVQELVVSEQGMLTPALTTRESQPIFMSLG